MVYHVSRTHKYIVMGRLAVVVDAYPKGSEMSTAHQLQMIRCFLRLDEAGILHNDGNALNLMLDFDNRLKIIDFGLSTNIQNRHTKKFASPNGGCTVYMLLISLKRYKIGAPVLTFNESSKSKKA